jgi:hypothetical protein
MKSDVAGTASCRALRISVSSVASLPVASASRQAAARILRTMAMLESFEYNNRITNLT